MQQPMPLVGNFMATMPTSAQEQQQFLQYQQFLAAQEAHKQQLTF